MYLDNNFSPTSLQTYQGYSLQVFDSGRIKLSFHRSHTDRVEYYGMKAKRFKEAYKRQHTRSFTLMPEHFDLVDRLLASLLAALYTECILKGIPMQQLITLMSLQTLIRNV